ncbi:hypothetical protein Rs2_49444 [Raphanus sativus]|nr:hypothetical protein Rs2_49444 [Raphanus sativus]
MPFRRSSSSQYLIIEGISKDIFTELNNQLPYLARPYAIRIWQTRGYMPPRPYTEKKDHACHYNANLGSTVFASERGSRSPTSDSNRYEWSPPTEQQYYLKTTIHQGLTPRNELIIPRNEK